MSHKRELLVIVIWVEPDYGRTVDAGIGQGPGGVTAGIMDDDGRIYQRRQDHRAVGGTCARSHRAIGIAVVGLRIVREAAVRVDLGDDISNGAAAGVVGVADIPGVIPGACVVMGGAGQIQGRGLAIDAGARTGGCMSFDIIVYCITGDGTVCSGLCDREGIRPGAFGMVGVAGIAGAGGGRPGVGIVAVGYCKM